MKILLVLLFICFALANEATDRQKVVNIMKRWKSMDCSPNSKCRGEVVNGYNALKIKGSVINRNTPWCAAAVSAAFYKAGLSSIFPCHAYCPTIAQRAKDMKIFKTRDYVPSPGDAILFTYDGGASPGHVGIVEKVNGKTIVTIEGNYSKKVGGREIQVGNSKIYGFVAPKFTKDSKPDTLKKPDEAAKKPDEAAKKPDEAAKKPDEADKKPDEADKKPETATGSTKSSQLGLSIVQKNSPNQGSRKSWKPDVIVCHITEGNYDGAVSWLCNKKSKASCHFVVSKKGEISQLVPINKAAWCQGLSKKGIRKSKSSIVRKRGVNPNLYCVGIEHEGFYSKCKGCLTNAQKNASGKLIKYIALKLKEDFGVDFVFDREHIIGHFEIDPVRKPNCPGKNFPWNDVIDIAKKA